MKKFLKEFVNMVIFIASIALFFVGCLGIIIYTIQLFAKTSGVYWYHPIICIFAVAFAEITYKHFKS